MTPQELLFRFRVEMDDAVPDYLWDDDSVATYMSEAQREYARRTRCLPGVEAVTVLANDFVTAMPDNIFDVVSVLNQGEGLLTEIPHDQMFRYESTETGTPSHYSLNYVAGTLRVWKTPTVDTTLEMRVYRLPKHFQTTATMPATLDIPDEFHEDLLTGMRAIAYRRHDPDAYDAGQARYFEGLWAEVLARRYSDHNIRIRQAGTVCYGGI